MKNKDTPFYYLSEEEAEKLKDMPHPRRLLYLDREKREDEPVRIHISYMPNWLSSLGELNPKL